ncbi:unnamed protein product [Vicia faba]|uniref:DRBM domain-containing protein n=1 Tax=Vicia faba TaxID=3906 RepID=A0AAV0ZLU2_VICFA|nr:unnamed protein product [Vicia faba]
MYKAKLQEMCQRRRWSLPKYSATSDGPPHMPNFKASVFVNGITFSSYHTFRSSKQAYNQAAMNAFLKLSSPSGSSIPTNKYGSKEEVEAAKPKPQESPVPPQSPDRIYDHLSKLPPQNYARKNNLGQPVFTIKTEGPSYDTRYKATVVIDGKSFESPTFFNTIKEAEQAAINIAHMFQQGDTSSSKSKLLELTQKEEGLEFHGKASSSKKQAEHDAAKVAYTALKESGLHMYAAFASSIKENEAVKSTDELDTVNVKSKQKLNLEDQVLDQEILPTNVNVNHNDTPNESSPLPPKKKMKISNMSDTNLARSKRSIKKPSYLKDYHTSSKPINP